MRYYGRRGLGRYNAQLHKALLRYGAGRISPTFFGAPDGREGEWRPLQTKWYVTQEQFAFPAAVRGRRYDVVHLTANTAPIDQVDWPALVVTVHDVMYLKSPMSYPLSGDLRQILGRVYRALAFMTGTVRAARFIVDSQQTATDIRRIFRRPPPIDVVYPAVDPSFLASPDVNRWERVCAARGIAPGGFFLHPGAVDPRKRTSLVLSAFGNYVASGGALDLVVFGFPSGRHKHLETLTPEAQTRVHILPWIPDDEVLALTQCAAAIVFVPTDEGFGYPLVEAMAAGTPAIATSIPVLKEISDGHALWVKPNDAAGLTQMLGSLETRGPRIQEMLVHARARATEFSLEKMAARTLAAYERAAEASTEAGRSRRG